MVQAFLLLKEQFSTGKYEQTQNEFWINQDIFDKKLWELNLSCPTSKMISLASLQIVLNCKKDDDISPLMEELLMIHITNIY